jgi:hypothetical protein
MSDNNTDNKTTLSQDIPENAQDLTIFVQNLLEQMVCVIIMLLFIINNVCSVVLLLYNL